MIVDRARACVSALPLAFHMSACLATILQQHLLAGAADHDRRMRLLQRLRQAHRVGHGVVLAVHRRLRLREHAADDLAGLVERVEAAGHGLEVDAEVLVLELEPAGADAEVEAAAADVVERRRHLRGDARVAVGVAVHQVADARPLGRLRRAR